MRGVPVSARAISRAAGDTSHPAGIPRSNVTGDVLHLRGPLPGGVKVQGVSPANLRLFLAVRGKVHFPAHPVFRQKLCEGNNPGGGAEPPGGVARRESGQGRGGCAGALAVRRTRARRSQRGPRRSSQTCRAFRHPALVCREGGSSSPTGRVTATPRGMPYPGLSCHRCVICVT